MPPSTLFGLLGCLEPGGEAREQVPLEGVKVAVTVRGFVAHIKAALSYKNTSKNEMQVQFRCPVDEGSAVYHVEAKLEDRTIIGQCLEKKKAEKIYSDAVEAGKTALLLREDQRAADVLNLALGNLPTESTAEVTLCIVSEVKVGPDGGVQFILPTVLNPRYCPADNNKKKIPLLVDVSTDDRAESMTVEVKLPYSIEVTANVAGGQSIARIVSHSDPINVAMEDDNTSAKITQDGDFRSDHDWSFVIYYTNPYDPHVLIESGDTTCVGLMKDQLLMINLFPELPESSYSRYNDVIFIVDRSDSMNGDGIQSARAVLLLFLKSLPPGCLFNVVSFGSSHSLLFPEGSRQYSKASLAEAITLHDGMDANMGGTVILQPLKTIYSKPANPEYSRQIILLTDGQVWNVDQVTDLARLNAGNTRVFTVGIGYGASTALVKGLARAGGGRAEMVTQRDRMQTKVMGLVASMLQSSIRNVAVSCEFDSPTRLSLVPPCPPVIFAGQHLVTYARMPPNAELKNIKLSGDVDGTSWSAMVDLMQMKTVHDECMSLHRLAARAKILHRQTDDTDDGREEVVELSVSSGVLSRYTALVAVDQDGTPQQNLKITPISTETLSDLKSRSATLQMAPVSQQKRKNQMQPQSMRSRCAAPPPPPPTMACNMIRQQSVMDKLADLCNPLLIRKTKKCGTKMKPENDQLNSKDKLFMKIIELQNFDGSWALDKMIKLLNIKEEELQNKETQGIQDAVLATALAVAVIQERFSSRSLEWTLLVAKAKGFLQGSGQDVGKLVENAKNILFAVKAI